MQKYNIFSTCAREEDFFRKKTQVSDISRIISGGRDEGTADWQSEEAQADWQSGEYKESDGFSDWQSGECEEYKSRIIFGGRDEGIGRIVSGENDEVIGRITSGERDEVKPCGEEKEINYYRKYLLPWR